MQKDTEFYILDHLRLVAQCALIKKMETLKSKKITESSFMALLALLLINCN